MKSKLHSLGKVCFAAGFLILGLPLSTYGQQSCETFDGNAIGNILNERISETSNTATNQSAFGRSELYFGGDVPDVIGNGGRSASVLESVATYNLNFLGSITVQGSFYNRDIIPRYNESYVGILPNNTALGNPLVGFPVIEREGISVGGISDRFLIFDHGDSMTDSTNLLDSNNIPLPEAAWYDLSATFAIEDSNLVIRDILVDGLPTDAGTLVVGPAADYPWLSNFRVVIAVDDFASEFCTETPEPPASVPTMSISGLALLALLTLLLGLVSIRTISVQ